MKASIDKFFRHIDCITAGDEVELSDGTVLGIARPENQFRGERCLFCTFRTLGRCSLVDRAGTPIYPEALQLRDICRLTPYVFKMVSSARREHIINPEDDSAIIDQNKHFWE